MGPQAKLIILLVAAIAMGAALWGYGEYRYDIGVTVTTDHFEAAIQAQKANAATTLADETVKTRSAELALQSLKNQQELKDVEHQKTVADLSDRIRRSAGPAGRLRDPNADQAPGCGASRSGAVSETGPASVDRSNDEPQAGGLLSAVLTGLLQQLTREADEINTAYTSCRADAFAVRQAH